MTYRKKLSVVGANEGPLIPAGEKFVAIGDDPLGRKFSPELKFQGVLEEKLGVPEPPKAPLINPLLSSPRAPLSGPARPSVKEPPELGGLGAVLYFDASASARLEEILRTRSAWDFSWAS
jgi:hypothetical protein